MNVTFTKTDLFGAGVEAHRAGRLAEAEQMYRRILAENPNHFDALHMLGLIAYQSGKPQPAMQLIQQSLQLNPNNASAHSNLAEVYRNNARIPEAEELCRKAIQLDPNLAPAYVNLSMALLQLGRAGEALPIAQRAFELAPNDATACSTLGLCMIEHGQLMEAAPLLERAVQLNPRDPMMACSLALCLARIERGEDAVRVVMHAAGLAPHDPNVLLNVGAVYAHLEKFQQASEWMEKCLAISPQYRVALEHMASIKTSLKQFDESIEMCQRVLAMDADAMDMYATMGEAMMNLGRFDETIVAMKAALERRPWPTVHQSLSNAYVRSGRPEEGLEELNKALALEPNNAVLHFNKAIILLLMGRFLEAWPELEWRWKHPRMVGRTRRFNVPEWKGEPLNGKRIFLHAEQGLGDTMLFGRYATKVAEEKGGKPVMWVQTQMVELAKTIPGVAEVVGEGQPLPQFDCHLAIMSLPGIFKTTIETIPNKVPFLRTDPARSAYWRDEFARRTKKFKVGLVWEGGPFQPENFLRSNSLAAYAPLADVPGVAFFGLQKGPAEAQCNNPPAGMDFTNLGPYIKDFNDTAAMLENLDLLISIDTSVVHVAGGLGKPIWMLLAWSPGQMWMYKREDSPWYPTMKIYRQPAFKDWATPVARVKADLLKLLAERK